MYSKWCALPLQTRHKVAKVFNIPKTGSTVVNSNRIESDGYQLYDIEKTITVESIQEYIGSGYTKETSLMEYWDLMIAKVEAPEPVIIEKGTFSGMQPMPIEKPIKKITKTRGTKTKKTK